MRKPFIFCLLVSVSLAAVAQERSGNIYGKVVDNKGEPVPGVTLTLSGRIIAPIQTISGPQGNFRFLSLSPATDYAIRAELTGFKTKQEEGIIVSVGKNVDLTIAMEMGELQEVVTVVARSPVVDTKRTGVVANITEEFMNTVPTGRDTRSLMSFVPGVVPQKTNMGEVQQGGMMNANVRGSGMLSYWGQVAVDGQRMTPRYFDQENFEEVQVSIGGTNMRSRSGDLQLNLVTKRGGNEFNWGARFFLSDKKFQAQNLTQTLIAEGVPGTDRVNQNKDYGFSVGGPIKKDKAWFFLSYGVYDSDEYNISDFRVKNIQTTYNAKLNFQLLPQNRLEIWGMANQMNWVGRSASRSNPQGLEQWHAYHFGDPFFHVQDEHMFGDNLFVAANVFLDDAGYRLDPVSNPENAQIGIYNQTTQIWDRYTYQTSFKNPRLQFDLQGTYFNEKLFGVSHEIKAALEWERVGIRGISDDDISQRYNIRMDTTYNTRTFDITGDGVADIVPGVSRLQLRRWGEKDYDRQTVGGYLSDTITIGDFNIILGARYDRVWFAVGATEVLSSINQYRATLTEFTPETLDFLDELIPAFSIPAVSSNWRRDFFSPRLGFVWDIGGKGITTAKLTMGRYPYRGDLVSPFKASEFIPLGELATLSFWWLDDNANKGISYDELYWHYAANKAPYNVFNESGGFVGDWSDAQGTFWDSYDPLDPTKLTSPLKTIPDRAPLGSASEIGITLEHELFTDFKIGINLTHKVYNRTGSEGTDWTVKYWPDQDKIENKDDYVEVGTLPQTIGTYDLGEAAGQPYYLYSAEYVPTIYTIETLREGYHHNYYGLDLIFEKRMSKKWLLNGSFTLQKDAQYFGETGYLNPTTNWAQEGRPAFAMFPRWIAKLQGIYRLPYGFNVGLSVFAREGSILTQSVTVIDYDAPNPRSQSVTAYIGKYGDLRLKPWVSLSAHLEKMIMMGNKGRLYFIADMFNIPNMSTVTARSNQAIGTYYVRDGLFVPSASSLRANQIAAPRMLRLGIRFQF